MHSSFIIHIEGSRTGLRATSGTVVEGRGTVSMKSDRAQRTEAVSWTIRTRSLVDVGKDL